MKSIFLRLMGVLFGIGLFFWIIGSLLPRDYSIRSSIEIQRPPQQVFPAINQLRNWKRWSSWGEIAGLEVKYSGEERGVGSVQTWIDPRGDGKLWITESKANELVAYKMVAGGFPEMDSRFELKPTENGTQVSWLSQGKLPSGPFYGYFAVFFGPGMRVQYDAGLSRLKSVIESSL